MGVGRWDDFFMRQKRRDWHALLPLDNRSHGLLVFTRGDGFGAGGGNALEQQLAELGEGGGFLTRNAALREQAEDLTEGAVHAGGRGEIAAGGIEFGKIETGADDAASG